MQLAMLLVMYTVSVLTLSCFVSCTLYLHGTCDALHHAHCLIFELVMCTASTWNVSRFMFRIYVYIEVMLQVAQAVGKHDTIGVDLVAMVVNDILAQGGEPLFFLDYFATGKLHVTLAGEVIKGIADGCKQAGCALVGECSVL